MGNYRRRLDIIADILYVVSGNARKTQVMYQANLSYRVLQKYLAELTGASLVGYDDERRCYVLTDKGRVFLDKYHEYSTVNHQMEKRQSDAHEKKSNLEKMCSSK